MIRAAYRAAGDLAAPEFRSALLVAVGLTLVLFLGVFGATEALLAVLTLVPWPWVETLIAVAAGLGLLIAFVFLMAPVTALFAGLFLDRMAKLVEERHYPGDPPGRPLPPWRAGLIAARFAGLVLIVNLLLLPALFLGLGALAILIANAYLLSREYFEMIAMRHLEPDAARRLRKDHAPAILMAGLPPALLAMLPVVNIVVPFFATSYFVHVFKAIARRR